MLLFESRFWSLFGIVNGSSRRIHHQAVTSCSFPTYGFCMAGNIFILCHPHLLSIHQTMTNFKMLNNNPWPRAHLLFIMTRAAAVLSVHLHLWEICILIWNGLHEDNLIWSPSFSVSAPCLSHCSICSSPVRFRSLDFGCRMFSCFSCRWQHVSWIHRSCQRIEYLIKVYTSLSLIMLIMSTAGINWLDQRKCEGDPSKILSCTQEKNSGFWRRDPKKLRSESQEQSHDD